MFGPGSWFGIEIGRRALQAETRSLDVVSHNLANVDTEGYTRQYAVHEASYPWCAPIFNQKITYGQLGTGVEISYIRRFRDLYLDNQWREVASALGYWNGMVNTLKKVEILIQEPDSDYQYGTQALIDDFFNVWWDLNSDPLALGVKEAVIQAANTMTNAFRQTYAQIENVRTNTDLLINDTIDRINEVCKQIVALNKEIDRVLFVKQNPNDLLDKRDVLLDELSSYGVMVQKVVQGPSKSFTELALADAPNPDHPGYIDVYFFGKMIVDGSDNTYTSLTRAEVDAWAGVFTEENLTIINDLVQQLAVVNDDIAAEYLVDPTSAAYRNLIVQRNILVHELGNYGKITADENADGTVELSFHDKVVIGPGNTVDLVTASDPNVTWVTAKQENGQLMGYIDGLKQIDYYLSQFDELAISIAEEVNLLHTVGNAEIEGAAAINVQGLDPLAPGYIPDGSQLLFNLDGKDYIIEFNGVQSNFDVIAQINAQINEQTFVELGEQGGRAYITEAGILAIRSYNGLISQITLDEANDLDLLVALGLRASKAEIVSTIPGLDIRRGDITDGDTLVLNLDGTVVTVTFSEVNNNDDLLAQINAELGTDGEAFFNEKGQLVLRSDGAVDPTITVEAGLSTPAALAALGLDTSNADDGHPVFFIIEEQTGTRNVGATYFYVNPVIADAPQLVNSDAAMDIANLRLKGTMADGTTTFSGYYNAITTGIGADLKSAQDRLGTQSLVMMQVDDMRQALVGVNEDEELTFMLQFNRSYQASSRMITVMDDLLDVLINRTAYR